MAQLEIPSVFNALMCVLSEIIHSVRAKRASNLRLIALQIYYVHLGCESPDGAGVTLAFETNLQLSG